MGMLNLFSCTYASLKVLAIVLYLQEKGTVSDPQEKDFAKCSEAQVSDAIT
jgi:hypothetical protein